VTEQSSTASPNHLGGSHLPDLGDVTTPDARGRRAAMWAERLWEAITDPAIRATYQFGASIESDWTAGSPYRLGHPAAERPLIEGENLVVERPNRLVQTMRALWGPDAERAGTSRVTWEIEPVGRTTSPVRALVGAASSTAVATASHGSTPQTSPRPRLGMGADVADHGARVAALGV
jgi:uncharacterized protein YndB with AHSA1/START domain